MNVLFVTHCTPMDGGNHSLLRLMVELQQPPYSVTPILLTPIEIKHSSSSILREAEKYGIKCIASRFYPFKYQSRSPLNFVRYTTNLVNLHVILHELKDVKIDLVHSNSSIFNIGALIGRRLGVPHIWHFREFGDWDFNLKPIFGRAQEMSVYRDASRIIAISGNVKNRFVPFIDKDRIDVIYNGIPVDTSAPVSKHDSEVVRFCITGALNKAKRQYDAVEAMNILINQRGYKNLHLSIIGEGKDRTLLEEKVKSYNLGSFVTFLGWVKDPQLLYADMDCGLMLSKNEAFGRVTIEYMRANLLVIASDGGANSELVDDDVTGFLFKTGDVSQLADKMAFAIDHQDKMKDIAGRGWKFSQSHFLSSDNTAAVYNTYLKYGAVDK